MAKRTYILFVESDSPGDWRLGACGAAQGELTAIAADPGASLTDSAAAVQRHLTDYQYTGEGIVLAIPSHWCLCGVVPTADIPRTHRRETMTYRLEGRLPLAVEQLAVDFVEHDGEALGVAVETDRVAPLLEALESADVRVDAVCPTALLILSQQNQQLEKQNVDTVWIQSNGQVDYFELREARPIRWRLLSSQNGDIEFQTKLQQLRSHQTSTHHALLECQTKLLESFRGEQTETETVSRDQLLLEAFKAAPRLLDGVDRGCVNLRCDGLAATDPHRAIRTPLKYCTAALIVMLICLTGSSVWRAWRNDEVVGRLAGQQQQVFRELLPNQRTPVDVRSRLESEARRMRAVSGNSSELPQTPSSLNMLHATLSRLPDYLRYRVLEIRIEGDQLYLEGEARAHSAADTVAASLRKQQGFEVEPPRTERMNNQSVSFAVHGRFATSPNPAQEGSSP